MKRFLAILLSFTLVASLAFGAFGAALADMAVTRIRTLNKGASLRDYPNGTKIYSVHMDTELDVYGQDSGWFYVYYKGMYGWVSGKQVEILAVGDAGSQPAPQAYTPACPPSYAQPYSQPYTQSRSRPADLTPGEMGVPYIGNTVFRENMMNLVVFWVQTQLKATGVWYQGYQWDVTGNLGDHTMQEISSFMQTMGYPGHSGVVDRNVINALSQYLGTGIVRVDIGGFYRGLKSLSRESSWGSMTKVMSNMIDGVPRVTLGARWIQVVLKRLGYYSGPIDGKYGEKTEAAVMKFQKDHGFQERNYLTLGVARCMLEQYYYAGGDVDQLP